MHRAQLARYRQGVAIVAIVAIVAVPVRRYRTAGPSPVQLVSLLNPLAPTIFLADIWWWYGGV